MLFLLISSHVKTSDNLEEFADELTLLKKDVHVENFQVYSNPLFEFDDNFTSSNVNPLFNEKEEDVENENSNISDSDKPVLLNSPLTNKVECSNPEDDIDEINVFLAMEVSFNFEEGYFDLEGDVTFLENLLSDDTTHNLAPKVISDHKPKQDESIHNTSITFSSRSDPLHHEFAGELLTLPSRIVREHEDYLNRMTLLCVISTSRSQENVHANPSSIIESLPISPIPIEDSVENDDSKDEDNELPNLDHQDNPSSPRPPPEPPDVDKCLEPEADDSKENSDDSLVKEQVSEDTSSFAKSPLSVEKETIFLVDKKIEFIKPKNHEKPVRKSVRPKAVNIARPKAVKSARPNSAVVNAVRGKPQQDDTGFIDSGCSRHMTGNIAYLSDFKEFDGGYVTFGGGAHGGRISGKRTLKTDSLDFKDILLKIPRKENMYSFDMKNIVPKESLTCLFAKATSDESMLWHRRLCHINFKNINKLVKDNLVRGLPTKRFENDQTCVACLKGKQHRASCKSKVLNPITKPLFMLHMDLFGPTFVSSLMHKKYCLVVTDDYSRFTWVFFLTTKDETSEILKNFIKEIENLVDKKVKIIRSDNGTEFKNKVMDDFCREKGIKREYSVARTPQQNGVAERRNRTLIEAARTMLADSKLPTTFWAEAVITACYVQNRVLVVKPHNKTPYELFRRFKPALSFMRPFGCHVTIINTLENLSKFDGKSNEGFFVGYSLSSKAFRVYNIRTRRVEENLHVRFLENKPMIEGNGLKWLFDIDSLTQSMNFVPVVAGTISNELLE
ncbi:putative ribonuclease H-like domain-containing protein [Tanacetum coccineum]